MAKVTGPLMSMSASGKLADAIVFFTWKGRNVVRQYLVPANPQSTAQGDQRIVMGGTGRAVGKIVTDSNFHDQLITLELIPGGQTKQSYMVKYILDNYLTNPTTYSNQLASMVAHSASDAIESVADNLGILEFDLSYADVAPYDKRLGIYLLGKASVALSFAGSPYTKTLASWTTTQWDKLQSDLEA